MPCLSRTQRNFRNLVSHEVFSSSFCKSQFLHKSVNLFFILVTVEDTLTDLWGSRLLPNDFENTLREIRPPMSLQGTPKMD